MHQAYQYYLNYHASIKYWVDNVIITSGISEDKFKKRLPSWADEEDYDPNLYDLDAE